MNAQAKRVWTEGFAVVLPAAGLKALAQAIREDDTRLIQGATTSPPPIRCLLDQPLEGADAVAFACWQAGHLDTIGEVMDAYIQACADVDELLDEPGAYRWFTGWWDCCSREERMELVGEIERAIGEDRQADNLIFAMV